MNLLNFEQYEKEIYNKKHIVKLKNGIKPKSRIHFDTVLNAKSAFDLVSNPKRVSKHWFLPFIAFDQNTRKITKHNGLSRRYNKARPLRYSANQDGYIYAYYAHILNIQYENTIKDTLLNSSILAYRSLGKSNIEFANEIFEWIKKSQNCNVLAIDLSSFFDTLDHDILKKQWQRVNEVQQLTQDHYMVFKSLTNYSFINIEEALITLGWPDKLQRKKLTPSTPNPLRRPNSKINQSISDFKSIRKTRVVSTNGTLGYLVQKPEKINGKRYGIPQGSPMSAILSNIYMIDFDEYCCKLMSDIGGIYRRYCDDIILLFPTQTSITQIYDELQKALLQYGGQALKVNPKKVEKIEFTYNTQGLHSIDAITKLPKPLQYLGFIYDGQKILLRSSSLSNYYRRLVSKIRASKNKAKNNPNNSKPYRRKIYRMYSHLAIKQKNFITYAYRSSKIMDEKQIKRQLSNHWVRIHDELKK